MGVKKREKKKEDRRKREKQMLGRAIKKSKDSEQESKHARGADWGGHEWVRVESGKKKKTRAPQRTLN